MIQRRNTRVQRTRSSAWPPSLAADALPLGDVVNRRPS